MRKLFLSLAILVSTAASCANFVTPKELAAELKTNKSLIVIDVMAADAYARQHIAGAINIPHKSLYREGPVEGQIKSSEELATVFGAKGVSNTSQIVLYDDGSQKYNSRVWWILKYLGATDVRLLHKEASQMEAARIPMTATPASLKAVTFAPVVNKDLNIGIAELREAMNAGNILLLDVREPDEFNGIDKDKKSRGHLPGSVYFYWKEVLTATGAYKSKDEILAAAAKAGVTPDKDIVVYCQTGIKAAVMYLALKEIAGFERVRLYAGAYAEWASDPANPVVK